MIAGPVLIAGLLEGIGRGLGNINLLIDFIPTALDFVNLVEHLLEFLHILLLGRDALVGVGDGIVDVLELRLGSVQLFAKALGGLLVGGQTGLVGLEVLDSAGVLQFQLTDGLESLGVSGGVEDVIESLLEDGTLLQGPAGVLLMAEHDVL